MSVGSRDDPEREAQDHCERMAAIELALDEKLQPIDGPQRCWPGAWTREMERKARDRRERMAATQRALDEEVRHIDVPQRCWPGTWTTRPAPGDRPHPAFDGPYFEALWSPEPDAYDGIARERGEAPSHRVCGSTRMEAVERAWMFLGNQAIHDMLSFGSGAGLVRYLADLAGFFANDADVAEPDIGCGP